MQLKFCGLMTTIDTDDDGGDDGDDGDDDDTRLFVHFFPCQVEQTETMESRDSSHEEDKTFWVKVDTKQMNLRCG